MFQMLKKVLTYAIVTLTICRPTYQQSVNTLNIVKGVVVAPIVKNALGKLIKNNGQYPYMASLQNKEKSSHRCGAVIIRDDVILTAAHCTENVKAADLRVKAGTFDLDDVLAIGLQVRRVQKYFNHPDHRKNVRTNNDISIVWIAPKFELGHFVNAIKLSGGDYSGEKAFTLGWGDDQNGKKTDFLMRADLSVLTQKNCKKAFISKPDYPISESMLCAIHKFKTQTTCSGDSGGPLVVQSQGRSKEDVLIGVSSWGIIKEFIHTEKKQTSKVTRCDPTFPSVFSSIQKFKEWIAENIN